MGIVRANDPLPGKARGISWEAGPGASVQFQGLPGPSPIVSASLPEISTTDLPNARVALRQGVFHAGSGPEHQGVSIYAVCLRAPASGLPPDLDSVALDRMNEKIEAELKKDGAQIDSFSPGRSIEQGHLTVVSFAGEATPAKLLPGVKKRLQGKNFIGFLGDPPDALLCSVACVETSTSNNIYCNEVVKSFALNGNFIEPPQPSFFSAFGYAILRRPGGAIGLVLGALLSVLGVALLVWPSKHR